LGRNKIEYSKELLMHKELLSVAAIIFTFVAFFPYIRSILKGKTRPHVFSWIIWGTTTFIVFLAQLAGGGGVGAWPIGVSGIITIYIALLAYIKKSDHTITKMDWTFLGVAITALPLWYVTSEPLWAVVILTFVDLLGFGPTIRKAYHFPLEENITFYSIFIARNIAVVFALEYYSLTTVLFPAAVAIASFILVVLIWVRRFKVARELSD